MHPGMMITMEGDRRCRSTVPTNLIVTPIFLAVLPIYPYTWLVQEAEDPEKGTSAIQLLGSHPAKYVSTK